MRGTKNTAGRIAVVFDRISLLGMLLILAAILTAAMIMQYGFGEIPCPLCLLQRFAMFGCCFGLIVQLRSATSEQGTGISLIFAILLLVISARQTLLDLFPRPGHEYIGSAIFGIHMPVWSVLIAVALAARARNTTCALWRPILQRNGGWLTNTPIGSRAYHLRCLALRN